MKLVNDVVQFLKHFWTIVKGWLAEYGFHNLILLAIAFYFYFLASGGLSNAIGHGLIGAFIALNLTAFNAVFKRLRDKNGW